RDCDQLERLEVSPAVGWRTRDVLQHCCYLVDALGARLTEDLVSDDAGSIWPGIFHAEAGRSNRARVRSTRDASSDTVASNAISEEQGARKKVLDNRQ